MSAARRRVRGSDPARVGDAARRVLGRLDRNGEMAKARAVSAWAEVAGAEIASHATGYAMRGGELVVHVDSPVWATELQALSERYRESMNELLGEETVRAMRFIVSSGPERGRAEQRRAQEVAAALAPPRVEPVEATEEEVARIEQMAEGICSEEVRHAVVSAAKRDLEWRKGLERARREGPGHEGAER